MALAGGALLVSCACRESPRDWWSALEDTAARPVVEISHPLPGAVMPANMPAPVVFWNTNVPPARVDRWVAGFKAGPQRWLFEGIEPLWRPSEGEWRAMKQAAGGGAIELVLAGYQGVSPGAIQARGAVRFSLAAERVETPLFYREVILPFKEAVKDPSQIRWRFGAFDQGTLPPVVLEKLPVCGNCHSFPRNGEYLAMDVDYANNKGSYIITRTGREMRLATSDIFTWDDFRREDGQQTFGLLSQISPDGRYVLSTVKDFSVFVPRPDLAFSQLFFPVKGILAVYDREKKQITALPGADDPALVQSNPAWSPDGQWIVFARRRATSVGARLEPGRVLMTPEETEQILQQEKEFRFDLYRLPFNGGKGGSAEPLRGASKNGRSNFFPKFSPDGRWLVFCQASNFMLLQPDSELFIIPAEGGEARRLACNLGRMNSWHSWSPDGRWLVFSSKAHSAYTQLYLSRINERGEASPAVWLAHLVAPNRAANIPEFVNLAPDAIAKIRQQFLDDHSYALAGNESYRVGDTDRAIERFQLALSLNPHNAMAHQRLGFLLYNVKNQPKEGLEHLQTAVRLAPENAFARFDLGVALAGQNDLSNALGHLQQAVQLMPHGFDRLYNKADMGFALAEVYFRLARYADSVETLEGVLRTSPNHAPANYLMALARGFLGETVTTFSYYERATRADPGLAALPDYYDLLSRNYIKNGAYSQALECSEKGCQLALAAGRAKQAEALRSRAEFCRSRL